MTLLAVVRASVLAEPAKLDAGALAVFVDEFERSFKVRAKAAPARTRLVGISQLPPRTRVVLRPICYIYLHGSDVAASPVCRTASSTSRMFAWASWCG